MAGPQNNFSAAQQHMTIFSPDGESFQTTRLNAIDLVRTGGYSWKKEDAGKNRPEGDGPDDPTANVVTIYDGDGNPMETTKLNARELVASGKFKWTTNSMTEGQAAQEVVDAAQALAEAEEAQEEVEAEAEEETSDEPVEESLTAEAARVTGQEDVAAYLEGFSLDALKQIASERYGEKIHHRASKETAIEKIVELEEARQLA